MYEISRGQSSVAWKYIFSYAGTKTLDYLLNLKIRYALSL